MKGNFRSIAALLAGLFFLALLVPAESAELKARFLQRKPLLEKMKDQGLIGENNLGFLAFRNETTAEGRSEENALVIQTENADRKTIYAEIAEKVKSNVDEVGRRRAVQIARLAAAGHWLQNAEGTWYQKGK